MSDILPWVQMNLIIADEIEEFRKIKSGVHISLLGTTRGGKTTLVLGGTSGDGILSHFENALIIDSTGDPGPIKNYGKPVTKFGAIHGHRRLSLEGITVPNRDKIIKYIRKAVAQENIAIYADEIRQLTDTKYFKLAPLFDDIYLFKAKRKVSLVGGTQAPRWVMSSFYDQSKMQFIFGIRDRRAMKRLVEISGNVDEIERIIPTLPRYHFAHVDIYGDVYVSKYQKTNARRITKEKQQSLDSSRSFRVKSNH